MDFVHPCLLLLLACLTMVGCAGRSRVGPSTLPTDQYTLLDRADLGIKIPLPNGWTVDKFRTDDNAVTQTWVGSSRRVALGVILFKLPFPVGHEITLAGFLQRFSKEDGAVTLVSKSWDEQRQAMRFVAHGQRRQVEALLIVRGTKGWAVFAGTLIDPAKAPPGDELLMARQSRDAVQTQVP